MEDNKDNQTNFLNCLKFLREQTIEENIPIRGIFFKKYSNINTAFNVLKSKYYIKDEKNIINQLLKHGYYIIIEKGNYYNKPYATIHYYFIEEKINNKNR